MNGIEFDREDSRKAKVLYDYEAVDESELTLYCDQVWPSLMARIPCDC